MTSVESLLPAWVVYGPWLWGPAYALLGGGATALLLGRVKLPPPEPWNERARVVHPIRVLLILGRAFILASAMVFIGFCAPQPEYWARDLAALIIVFLGTAWPVLHFESALAGGRSVGQSVRSFFARWTLSSALVPVLLGPVLIAWVDARWKLWLGLGIGAAFSLWIFGLNLWLVRALGLARPAPEKVRAAVERAAKRVGVQFSTVLELDWLAANALAFPLTRAVVFTKPMAQLMSEEELEAVAAHELGHLSEPWRIKLSRPLAIVGLYAALAAFAGHGQLDLPSAVGLLCAVLLIAVWLGRVRRSGERHADATAHDDGKIYGRALERLYAFNLVPAVLRRPGPHGHLYDRLVASGYTPSWPRPPPPERPSLMWRVAYLLLAVAPLVVAVGWDARFDTVGEAHRALAFGPRSGWAYERLAREEAEQGRSDRALAFYGAALELEPKSAFLHAAAARELAVAGRCDDARSEYAQAEQLRDYRRQDVSEAMRYAGMALAQCAP